MKNLFLFCAFLLIAFGQCSGQSQGVIIVGDDNGAVGNEVLQSARTATVVIKMGNPANADAARYVPDFSRAKKQLIGKLSKKVQLVANPADADIVIVAVELNEGENGNTICLGDKVEVFKGGKTPSESDAPIWAVNEYCGFSWPLNRALDKLIKAMELPKEKKRK